MGRRRRSTDRSMCLRSLTDEVYKKCVNVGYIAAALGPKHKIRKYLKEAGVRLPAGIPIEEWDSFHDFIVYNQLP